jgi:DNA-binding transcriptional MerR regulator
MSDPTCRWRIDELARLAGVTVDTIRYYARERLLPPGAPAGRNRLYGQSHLDRLARIRALQEKHFSLAAIRELLNAGRPELDSLFAGGDAEYTHDDLVERSGLDGDFVRRLHGVGLLADARTLGHDHYDDADLALLRDVAELLSIGMTEQIVIELAKIYVRHFDELQQEVHRTLAGVGHDDWSSEELDAIQRRLTANASRMLPAVDRVLGYVHRRTVQRLTLDAIRTAHATGTGVGGVKGATPDV